MIIISITKKERQEGEAGPERLGLVLLVIRCPLRLVA